MLPRVQTPDDAFDYSTLTLFHNEVYDTPLGLLLTAGWFVALAASCVLFVMRRMDVNRPHSRWEKRMFSLGLILLIGPPAVAAVFHYAGMDDEKVPHVVGYLKGAMTTDPNAEFAQWAHERYGIALNENQTIEVQKLTDEGFMVQSNQTRPILFNGQLIHGLFAADQVVLVDTNGVELPIIR